MQRERLPNIPDDIHNDGEPTANSEAELEKILWSSVYFALNRLFDDVRNGSVSRAGCSEINAHGASFLKQDLKLLLLHELKRHNLTAYGIDLVSNCKELLSNPASLISKDSLDAVQQLVG